MGIGQELLNVPMGDMIRQMAFAIADAQLELDESSVRVAELMSGQYPRRDEEGNLIDAAGEPTDKPVYVDSRVFFGEETVDGKLVPSRISMMELGFTPTFYQFIDTLIEVKIAIKITREIERKKSVQQKEDATTKTSSLEFKRGAMFAKVTNRTSVTTTTVDASYSAKYSYSAEGSSLLRTKLAPVPPPPVLEERIRKLIEDRAANPPSNE